MARRVKIGKYDIHVPKDSAWRIDTPPDQIRMHALMIAVAKRGGGKTVALTSLLRSLQKDKALDRLFLITPTYASNFKMFEGLPIEDEDIYHDPRDPSVIPSIIEKAEAEMKAYKEWEEKAKVRKELEKALKGTKSVSDVYRIDPELILKSYNFDVLGEEPPKHKWGGRKPVLAVLCDDCQGTSLLNNKTFQHFCLRHRHIADGLGVSVFMACQNYKARCDGMPLAIRDNCTHLLVFRSKNVKVLQGIFDEVADNVTEEQFYQAYDAATDEEHSFLTIDFAPKR